MRVRPSKTVPTCPAQPAPERTLAQQKADFTAEGAPPSGQVAGAAATPAAGDVQGDALALRPGTPAKGAAPARRQPPQPAGPVRRASKRHGTAWRGNS
jgi:hypothetical protein